MNDTAQNKLELFANNTQTIKKEFTWQNNLTKRLAALLYAQEGKLVDCETIQQCHDLIKQNTGIFSTFRGHMAFCVATLLSLTPNPQEVFNETLKVYDLLKGVKLKASDFLVVTAYQIAAQSNPLNYKNVVTRTRAFYDGMKARHFFYTGQDDYIMAAMLGLSDLDVEQGTERIENLYTRLKGEFHDKNSVQALAQVLALGDSYDGIANRVLALRDALRAQKIKLDKTNTLPLLGILALLPVEIDTIVRDIGVAQDTLRKQKGFGSLSIDSQKLLIFAASIVVSDYAESVKDGLLTATLSTTITNIIIAEIIMLMVIVIYSMSAASASTT